MNKYFPLVELTLEQRMNISIHNLIGIIEDPSCEHEEISNYMSEKLTYNHICRLMNIITDAIFIKSKEPK